MRICCISFFVFLSSVLFPKTPREGIYRAVLVLQASPYVELPFNFDLRFKNKKPVIIIRNADERIVVDEITIKGDSVNFKMPVFDTEFRTRLSGDTLKGVWINHYRTLKNVLLFKACFGDSRRFVADPGQPDPLFEGKWEATFSGGTADESKAIGLFHHQEQTNFVTGTFLTETGDYRYLEGIRDGNTILLSCFDGSHAFLFTAHLQNNALVNGKFYSGAHSVEDWAAVRNEAFRLKDPGEITFVKRKEDTLKLTFPGLDGKLVSLNDTRFGNKPVIVQVMGSWCPNCMDESIYFEELYKKYKSEGLEIIALAFEKADNLEKATSQVKRMKERLGVDYTIMITLKTGKTKAGETLPMLNNVSAFPTTLFLNRKHQIVKTHTGFSGPATGEEYGHFKQETEAFIKNLLKD
jgi:thiol-disulfide isomerase/thioredoxin